MTSSLTTNSNTNQYTHRLFFSLTGCLLHHKKSFISPLSTYLLFLVPQVAFTIKKKPFISPHSLIHHHRLFFASSFIKNITNTYTHYQLAFLVSSIQSPILARIDHLIFSLTNSNTNPGQDWSHAFQSPQFQIPILARIGHMIL